MTMAKIWNGRLTGVPMFAAQAMKIAMGRIADGSCTLFWRGNLAEVGQGAQVQAGAVIRYPGNIRLGPGSSIGRHAELESEFSDSRCIIGADSQINRNALIDFSGGLEIGAHVVISEHASVYTHSHSHEPKSKPVKTPLIIEDGAWIGAHARIMEGVGRIGANAVVAAGAVVTKEVSAGDIVGGIPARVIGRRNGTSAS